MLQRFMPLLLALCAALLLGGCYAGTATVAPRAPGFLYADYNMNEEASGPQGAKTGEACVESILGLVATGDAGIEAARREAGIDNVTAVDRRVKNILGVYAKICTVVHGS